jgi:predicted PurR-regulated permease PerM
MTRAASRTAIVDLVVQIACLALLLYWSFLLVKPFITIIIWSVILADLLYPGFAWLIRRLHLHRVIAALLVTAFCLAILLGPATWLGLSLVETLRTLAERLGSGDLAVPPPPDAVKHWPVIGEGLYDSWSLASTNLKAAFVQIKPQLRPISTYLLSFAGSAGIGMIKFVIAIVISGFLLLPGPALAESVRSLFRRVAERRGDEFVDLIGATIRNLARGVIGVSLLQALLAGLGFIVAGIPAAGLFSILMLILGIVQIDAAIITVPLIAFSWIKLDATTALIFTVYMVPVTLLNNFLRPFVMARGLKTPMVVILIGVIGGILAHGVIGLFVGPIVLAIAWELLKAWTFQAGEGQKSASISS